MLIEEVTTFGMSFTQTKNKVDLRIVPLGTPDVTGDQFENVSRIVTLCCLFFRKFLDHSNKRLSIPCRGTLVVHAVKCF